MSKPIIKVEGLGKKYVISHEQRESYTALRDVIGRKVRKLTNLNKVRSVSEDFWALKDVSFEINPGDAVGIIGRNGAGKSTLLKLLSRITEPSTGRIEINGRIASLLEVGTGFHPELTGRENIFLNGAILGMSRLEIKRKFDEIVEFSGVDKFLDTPVKRYSSGMYVRLAFSVAAHLEPEILIVDEVLAVGDLEFQKKCLGKLDQVTKSDGRTVLFVSHNLGAIQNICKRAVLLNNGLVTKFDKIDNVIGIYLRTFDTRTVDISKIKNRSGTGNVVFWEFSIEGVNQQKILTALTGRDLILVFKLKFNRKFGREIDIGFSVHNRDGKMISVLYSSYQNFKFDHEGDEFVTVKCKLVNISLNSGTYEIRGRLLERGIESDWPKEPIGMLLIERGDYYNTGSMGFEGDTEYLIKGQWSYEII